MQPERRVFISSCTRREMARRRPQRHSPLRLQLMVALAAVAAVLAFLALRGAL
jgi:hypothetical protein